MQTLPELFREMAQKHRHRVRDYLAEYGLYLGQQRILFALEDTLKLSQRELCESLKVSKESLSVSLKRLENSGLLIRENSVEDRRVVYWRLSKRGEVLTKQCREGFDSINNQMFSTLTPEETESLGYLFRKMIDGLEK